MKTILVVVLSLLALPADAGQCPVGTYPWVDRWGNRVCKRFWDGGIAAIEGKGGECPAGTHPWVDSWGNRTCRAFDGGRQYYDISEGCPTGTYRWTDSWGNGICRRF
jgi:hypothetical protein